jgi:hypothetical protein
MRKTHALVALLGCALLPHGLGAAKADDDVRNQVSMPKTLTLIDHNRAQGVPFTVAKNDILYSFAVNDGAAAELAAPVAVTISGQLLAIKQDVALIQSRAAAEMAQRLDGSVVVFCMKSTLKEVQPKLAMLLSSKAGAARPCLADKDKDGAFDTLFLANTRGLSDTAFYSIAPTRYRTVIGKVGERVERIDMIYKGYSGIDASVHVNVRRFVNGKSRDAPVYFIGIDGTDYWPYQDWFGTELPKGNQTSFDFSIACLGLDVIKLDREANTMTAKISRYRELSIIDVLGSGTKVRPVPFHMDRCPG